MLLIIGIILGIVALLIFNWVSKKARYRAEALRADQYESIVMRHGFRAASQRRFRRFFKGYLLGNKR